MTRDEVTHYAKALILWSPGHAADHAARRRQAFSDIGDEERAQTWRKIEKRILTWQSLRSGAAAEETAVKAQRRTPAAE